MLKLSNFDYKLPQELIAQYPLKKRDAARLLVLNRKQKSIEHLVFKDIFDFLGRDDLLVLNDTKVLPVRLKAWRLTGGKVELLLLNQKKGTTFNALVKPSRLKLGEEIIFNGGRISGILSAKSEITFSTQNLKAIYNLGTMPLPPYIKREPKKSDDIYYQTVYAKQNGSIAAPTAGLHFSRGLINKIASYGIKVAYITLHISYSTFRPVKIENIIEHKMDKEYFRIDDETIKLIDEAKIKKARIFAVGTTSLRALETYASGLKQGYTDLFIHPGYKFKMVDHLLTNFHLPRTSLFILVCAFAGEKLIKKAYQEAIDRKYRFYSYGDAMLIM